MLLRSKGFFFIVLINAFSCLPDIKLQAQNNTGNKALHQLFDEYNEEYLRLNPVDATYRGDNRYNNLLSNDGAADYLRAQHNFFIKYQNALKQFNFQKLDEQDKISCNVLLFSIDRELEGEKFHPEYLPITQSYSLPLTIGQLGSGTGAQTFKTEKDYDDWLKRITAFTIWTDTAIANMRKGAKAGVVLPKALVVKIIPQIESLAQTDSSKSIFMVR